MICPVTFYLPYRRDYERAGEQMDSLNRQLDEFLDNPAHARHYKNWLSGSYEHGHTATVVMDDLATALLLKLTIQL